MLPHCALEHELDPLHVLHLETELVDRGSCERRVLRLDEHHCVDGALWALARQGASRAHDAQAHAAGHFDELTELEESDSRVRSKQSAGSE